MVIGDSMKVAVIGGTGHVSKYLLATLTAAGHRIRLLSRKPVVPGNLVETVTGDARLFDDVFRVVEGCDVVVNCVGRLKNDTGFYERITANIVSSMRKSGIRCYVLVTNSALRLDADIPTTFSLAGAALFRLVFPRMVEDKERELRHIFDSGMDWVVFRLPIVLDAKSESVPRMDRRSLRGLIVSNGAVAHAIAREIETLPNRGNAPFLFD